MTVNPRLARFSSVEDPEYFPEVFPEEEQLWLVRQELAKARAASAESAPIINHIMKIFSLLIGLVGSFSPRELVPS